MDSLLSQQASSSCPLPLSSAEVQSQDLSIGSDSPPMKKQKLKERNGDEYSNDEGVIITTERIVTGSTYDSEEDYCPEGVEKMDKAVWERYFQQIDDSEGFDIKDYPGSCWMATIWPMLYYLDNPKNVEELKGFARRALELYNNERGTKHEVADILKVNGAGCRGFIYYITLSVKTGDGEKEYFQVKVVQHLDLSLEFPIIRPRAKGDVGI